MGTLGRGARLREARVDALGLRRPVGREGERAGGEQRGEAEFRGGRATATRSTVLTDRLEHAAIVGADPASQLDDALGLEAQLARETQGGKWLGLPWQLGEATS